MVYASNPGAIQALYIRLARKRAFREQRGRCFWCDREMVNAVKRGGTKLPSNQCTSDHLIPTAKGGPDDEWNIIAACNRCNNERGDMPADQWLLRIRARIGEAHFAVVLQKLTKWGIDGGIGQPAPAAPTVEHPIVRAPEVEAPAPQGQPGNRSEGQPKDHPPSTV